mmetsp:Transcript_12819/g.16839  ORF Transcript_12819/g.16839 Transcript_12819/m.16839 type:complete len:304 (+) Transcript_12819:31-942(+)
MDPERASSPKSNHDFTSEDGGGFRKSSLNQSGRNVVQPLSPLPTESKNSLQMDQDMPLSSRSNRSTRSAMSSRSRIHGATPGVSAMLDAKNARKRAEADVKLLQNRLKHLQMEEERAFKKVAETKARAKEIMVLKQRNNEHHSSKHEYKSSMSQLLSQQQNQIHNNRMNQKNRLNQTFQQLQRDRQHAGLSGKKEREQLNDEYKRQRESEYRSNFSRAEQERQRKKAAKEKALKEKLEKERKLQEEYARKINEEAKRRSEAEDLIRQLEEQEEKMIGRLRKAQEDQRNAYEDLRTSLDFEETL